MIAPLFTLPQMTSFTGSSPAPGKLAFAWSPIVFPAAAQIACSEQVACPSYNLNVYSSANPSQPFASKIISDTTASSFTFPDTFQLGAGTTVTASILASCLDANFVSVVSPARPINPYAPQSVGVPLTCSVVLASPTALPTTPYIVIHEHGSPDAGGTVYADIGYLQTTPYTPNPPLQTYVIQATDLINPTTGNKTFTINAPVATAQGIPILLGQPLTGLTGNNYMFQVQATNLAASSAFSVNPAMAGIDAGGSSNSVWIRNPPVTPVLNSVMVATNFDGQLNLNASIFYLNASSSSPSSAVIYYYPTSNPSQVKASPTIATPYGSSTNLTASLSGLADSTLYSVYVITQNAYGFSARSNVLTGTPVLLPPPPSVPVAPTNLSGTSLGSTEISVSYTVPTYANPAISDYKVTYAAPTAVPPITPQFQFVTSNPLLLNGVNSFVLNGLNPLTTYTISIQAENQLGFGAASNAINVKTQSDTIIPSAPILNSVLLTTISNIAEIQVNFVAVQNASSYSAYFTPDVISTTLLPQHVSGYASPLTITQSALQSGELYHVSVTASNSAGESARSSPMSITINNGGSTVTGTSNTTTLIAGAGVLGLIVLFILLVLFYRKRKTATKPT
jgi:hypothetical protein